MAFQLQLVVMCAEAGEHQQEGDGGGRVGDHVGKNVGDEPWRLQGGNALPREIALHEERADEREERSEGEMRQCPIKAKAFSDNEM